MVFENCMYLAKIVFLVGNNSYPSTLWTYAYVYVSFFKTTGQQSLSPSVPPGLPVTQKKSRTRSLYNKF
jgi:hypothetical protein